MGEQVQLVGKLGAGRTEGVPKDLGEQVELVRVSRGLGGQGEPLVLLGNRYSL